MLRDENETKRSDNLVEDTNDDHQSSSEVFNLDTESEEISSSDSQTNVSDDLGAETDTSGDTTDDSSSDTISEAEASPSPNSDSSDDNADEEDPAESLNPIASFFYNKFKELLSYIFYFIGLVFKFVNKSISIITDFFVDNWNMIVNFVVDTWNTLVKAVKDNWKKVTDYIINFLGTFTLEVFIVIVIIAVWGCCFHVHVIKKVKQKKKKIREATVIANMLADIENVSSLDKSLDPVETGEGEEEGGDCGGSLEGEEDSGILDTVEEEDDIISTYNTEDDSTVVLSNISARC